MVEEIGTYKANANYLVPGISPGVSVRMIAGVYGKLQWAFFMLAENRFIVRCVGKVGSVQECTCHPGALRVEGQSRFERF